MIADRSPPMLWNHRTLVWALDQECYCERPSSQISPPIPLCVWSGTHGRPATPMTWKGRSSSRGEVTWRKQVRPLPCSHTEAGTARWSSRGDAVDGCARKPGRAAFIANNNEKMARRPGVMKPTVAVWLALATVAVTEAVAEAAGACALVDGCIANHPNLLRTANGLTVDQCCRACTGDYKCAAWTRYLPPGGSVPLCNLFATVVNGTPGLPNCTSGRTGEKAPRPNFVFSFPDTLRAESFSGYGIDLDVTPNLAKFAETGVRFEQAHVMHTQCSPSRCTSKDIPAGNWRTAPRRHGPARPAPWLGGAGCQSLMDAD